MIRRYSRSNTPKTGAFAIAWSPKKASRLQGRRRRAGRHARREQGDEYRRLLYVALTRAEERLYIAGFHGARPPAVGQLGADDRCDAGQRRRHRDGARVLEPGGKRHASDFDGRDGGRSRGADRGSVGAATPASAPDWLWRRVEPEVEAPLPIRPSKALAAADRWSDAALTPARREALRIGSLTHVLLEYLPDLPEEGRQKAAQAFLEARAADLEPGVHAGLIDAALRVIDAPDLAALFGPQSRAEVAVAGRVALPRGGAIDVVGRIDRIGVTVGEVLIADFKTGAACAAADIPQRYLAQMALYRAALAPLWPEKRLRMLLIWTGSRCVVTLDDARLDEALAAIEAGSTDFGGNAA